MGCSEPATRRIRARFGRRNCLSAGTLTPAFRLDAYPHPQGDFVFGPAEQLQLGPLGGTSMGSEGPAPRLVLTRLSPGLRSPCPQSQLRDAEPDTITADDLARLGQPASSAEWSMVCDAARLTVNVACSPGASETGHRNDSELPW